MVKKGLTPGQVNWIQETEIDFLKKKAAKLKKRNKVLTIAIVVITLITIIYVSL